MKLYTEEQVKQIVLKSRETGLTAEYLMLTHTPIELPSDEEIENGWHDDLQADYIDGCINGARWMREQILKQQS